MEREGFGWLLWFEKVRYGRGHSGLQVSGQDKWTWMEGLEEKSSLSRKMGNSFSDTGTESINTEVDTESLS